MPSTSLRRFPSLRSSQISREPGAPPHVHTSTREVIASISKYDISRLQVWPPVQKCVTTRDHLQHLFFQRLHVLVIAIPLSLFVVLMRYINLATHDDHPLTPIDYTLVAPMVTIASFIMGTVLNNVMADYKESEKIPAELVAYFHSILIFARTEAVRYGYDAKPLLHEVEAMLLSVMAHLDHCDFGESVKVFNNALLNLCRIICAEAHKHNGHVELEVVQHAAQELVKKWGRVHDISRTSIILPGYTLLDLLTALMSASLICVEYSRKESNAYMSGYWACGIFSTIIFYINILVRRLDDPFDAPRGYHFEMYVNGGPVALSLLEEVRGGCSIDFEPLFSDFGSELRELLYAGGKGTEEGRMTVTEVLEGD